MFVCLFFPKPNVICVWGVVVQKYNGAIKMVRCYIVERQLNGSKGRGSWLYLGVSTAVVIGNHGTNQSGCPELSGWSWASICSPGRQGHPAGETWGLTVSTVKHK